MENEERTNKYMKVEIPSETEMIMSGGGSVELSPAAPTSGQAGVGVLTRQTSAAKNSSCLCSPTTHAGSFRCRLHRSPSLQRTKSMDLPSNNKPNNTATTDATANANTVAAQ